MPVIVTARTRMDVRTPVSAQTRRRAIMTSMKMSRAAALPMEAIAVRLNPSASTRLIAAATRSPDDARPRCVRR